MEFGCQISTFCVPFFFFCTNLRSIPPSREALRHSGGDSLLFTSAMVTLYLEVELSSDRRPGTEQKRSVGFTTHVPPATHTHTTHLLQQDSAAVGLQHIKEEFTQKYIISHFLSLASHVF